MTLARPVAANSPLQSYFVDPDFAAVVAPRFRRSGGAPDVRRRDVAPAARRGELSLTGLRRWALGRANYELSA